MEQTVFISYAREDSPFARRLGEDLRGAGIDVWLDQINTRGGQAWDEAVEAALANSAAVIVVLTPSAISSQTVRDEVSYALEKNRTVTPVLYQQCQVPLRLIRLPYADFMTDYDAGLAELRRLLASLPAATQAQTEENTPAWEAPARLLAAHGLKMNAIRYVHEMAGLELKEAQHLVKSWSYPPPDRTTSRASAIWETEARALLAQGEKYNAIKLVREKTGLGMRDAQDLLESW